jgi:hypothetical protein
MATKIKMLKLLQETRGLAQVTNRRPLSRQPGLVILQIRENARQPALKRKRHLLIDMQERLEIPHAVRINHRKDVSQPATSPATA